MPISIRHDPPLGNTLNVVWILSGPHSRSPAQTPVEGTMDPLAIRSFREDGLSGESLRAIRIYAAVSIALIMAPLLTTARKRTCSPFGPRRLGVVRKGLLVRMMIGFPSSFTRYTSVASLLEVVTSPFSCVI